MVTQNGYGPTFLGKELHSPHGKFSELVTLQPLAGAPSVPRFVNEPLVVGVILNSSRQNEGIMRELNFSAAMQCSH